VADKDQKVNCRAIDHPYGSHHLVFMVQGTTKCVGEMKVAADDRYLLVIGQLFGQWTTRKRGRLPSTITKILHGTVAR